MTLQEYNDLYKRPLLKQMTIVSSGGITIKNANIVSEEMSLEKSLCSETNLRYGRCEAACFKVRIADINHDFTGEWLTVTQDVVTDSEGYLLTQNGLYLLTEDGYKIKLKDEEIDEARAAYGRFRVHSDKPSNDRRWRDLTCYDIMYDILNADVISWYNGLTFPMTLKNLRDSFFTYLGITQETTTLINDSFVTPGGFSVSGSLSGKTVIESICELNGVFGQITGDGKFQYVSLSSPPTLTLDYYVDGTGSYEDYVTEAVTGINAKGTTDDVGTIVGTSTNLYIINGNPLIYGTEGTQGLTTALNNLLQHIMSVQYRPYGVTTYGNPMLPLGTKLTINTKNQIIVSYVVKKTLNGIQSLKDTLSATGEKHQPTAVNSPKTEITRTKGKVHELEVTVDGLTSRVSATETNLANNYSTTTQMNSAITQAVDSIETIVSTATSKYDTTGLTIDYFGYGAPSSTLYPPVDNNGKHYLDNNSGQVYVCNGSTWSASGNPLTLITSKISSQLTQLSDKVAVKVNSSGRLVTAELGVDSASSTSYVKVKADDLDIIANGNLQLTAKSIGITSTNFSVTCSNITATGGRVGGWKISSNGLYDDRAETTGDLGAGCFKYGTGPAFWAGCDLNNTNHAPFRVLHDGTFVSSKGLIAGWTITSGKIYGGDSSSGVSVMQKPSSNITWVFASGGTSHDSYANCPFKVSKNGSVFAKWLNITPNSTSGAANTGYFGYAEGSSPFTGLSLYGSNGSEAVAMSSTGSIKGKTLTITGTKNRIVETEDYGNRLLYCYETPTPMFGDIGEGKIAEDGKCYIWIDSVFRQTIAESSYQVFIQKYNDGECFISERKADYFVVEGTPGLKFGWEIKAKQKSYDMRRLDQEIQIISTRDYGTFAIDHLNELNEEREVA